MQFDCRYVLPHYIGICQYSDCPNRQWQNVFVLLSISKPKYFCNNIVKFLQCYTPICLMALICGAQTSVYFGTFPLREDKIKCFNSAHFHWPHVLFEEDARVCYWTTNLYVITWDICTLCFFFFFFGLRTTLHIRSN